MDLEGLGSYSTRSAGDLVAQVNLWFSVICSATGVDGLLQCIAVDGSLTAAGLTKAANHPEELLKTAQECTAACPIGKRNSPE